MKLYTVLGDGRGAREAAEFPWWAYITLAYAAQCIHGPDEETRTTTRRGNSNIYRKTTVWQYERERMVMMMEAHGMEP
jgi:hypothetical protein